MSNNNSIISYLLLFLVLGLVLLLGSLMLLHLRSPQSWSSLTLHISRRLSGLRARRARLLQALEQHLIGRWLRRLLTTHLSSFTSLGIYGCLFFNYYQGNYLLLQFLGLALAHFLMMRELELKLAQLQARVGTPEKPLLEVYYASLMLMYLAAFIVLNFFFSDYFALFQKLPLLKSPS